MQALFIRWFLLGCSVSILCLPTVCLGALQDCWSPATPDRENDQPQKIELWGSKIPGLGQNEKPEIVSAIDQRIGERVTRVTRPILSVYAPDKKKDTGAAVIICPGGGYNILAYDLEGTEVAKWLTKIGVTGLVLHYRVPRSKTRPKHELPLMDLQRASRVVRARAGKLGIDPERVGVLGFSAGGHLAAMASTAYAQSRYQKIDKMDLESCRPNFSILVYPAYLNKANTVELTDELVVDSKTPPAILIHTGDDGVSSLGSVAYYTHLKKSQVSAELHIFPNGGHGYGLRPSGNAVCHWPKITEGWMRTNGFLKGN